MTCIVGIEHTTGSYLFADSLGSGGWHSTHRRDGKLHELRPATTYGPAIALGFTSSYRMGQALGYGLRSWAKDVRVPAGEVDFAARHEWMVTTFVPEVRRLLKDAGYLKADNGREEGGTFIVAVGRHVFTVQDDLQVASSEDGYSAVGCGEAYALGAMHACSELGCHPTPVEQYPMWLGQHAMAAAMRFSNGVGGRVDVQHVPERAA